MITPKIIQVKDYSSIIGKEFILLEDAKKFPYPLFNGTKFVVKSIKNNKVKIKVKGTDEELKPAVELDFKRWIKMELDDIKETQKIVDMWNKNSEQYIIDKDDFWNNMSQYKKGAPINTGYPIPSDNPNYDGGDAILTFNYIRKDGVTNTYSYKKGQNRWWSKETYEFIILGHKKMIKELENCENPWFKLNLKNIKNQELTISKLNSVKFRQI